MREALHPGGQVLWAAILVALVACSPGGGERDAARPDASIDARLDALPPDAGPAILGLAVVPNPNSVLSAKLTFTTDRPATAIVHIANTGAPDNSLDTPVEPSPVTSHAIPLLGMRALSTFALTATATDAEGRASSATASFQTPALPAWVPPIVPVLNDKSRTSPGYTMLNVEEFSGYPVALPQGPGTGLVAVDADFQVVWYMKVPGIGGLDPEKLPSGDLVYLFEGGWARADMMGNVLEQHPASSLQLTEIDHALQPEQGGRLLSLTPELRLVSGYPGAADGGTRTLPIVGEQVVEVPADGGAAAVLADTFDFFDAHREGNRNLFDDTFWNATFPDAGATFDWIHANSVVADPSDGTLVASSRTQSWIFKVTRQGKLVWRLGYQGDFTLTNPGAVPNAAWPYGQHGVYLTPSGTVMCFDDGDGRPPAPGCTTTDAGLDACYYSRAVELAIDTTRMEATVVWEYGSPTYGDPDNFYSTVFGSAYALPGGTVLVDDGCSSAKRTNSAGDPEALKWARIIEVTHAMPAERIAEFDVYAPLGGYPYDPQFSGFSVYRAYRLPSLYAGSVGSADDGDR